jgi:RimJ/RimL family protein N-acetyltransferase
MTNLDQVVGWVDSFWRSHAAFTQTGVGFCVTREQTITAWCLTVFASERQRELGVATVPQFRSQGFATLAAAATLEYCMTQGWTPHWHCWEDNIASQRVAEKLGFEQPKQYSVYRCSI